MPEGGKTQGSADPTALWRQWSGTAAQAWSNVLGVGKEQITDSYDLYRSWVKSMADGSEKTKLTPLGMLNPGEVWKLWFDSTVGVWRKAVESGGDPLGFITVWLKIMEETNAKVLAGEPLPTNLFALYKQWYDATSDTWAEFVERTMGSEELIAVLGPSVASYASFIKTFRKAEEEYLRNLQIPTRSDIARVAELIVTLEEKLDQIDDTFEEGYSHMATRESVEGLEKHLVQVESKLEPLPAALEKAGGIESLTQRLGHVESKLDTLSAAFEKSRAGGEIEHLAQRIDKLESKLDAVLTSLEKLTAQASLVPTKSSNSTAGKASKKTTSRSETTSQPEVHSP